MTFAVISAELLKNKYHDKDVEYRRKSRDGSLCIIHKNLMDELMRAIGEEIPTDNIPTEEPLKPQAMPLQASPRMMAAPMSIDTPKIEYPFQLVNGDEIDNMPEFKPIKEENIG